MANGGPPADEPVSTRDAYAALVQLVIHAESITWNRFYNFLMGNSILVLAWSTVFASQARDEVESQVVLAAISLLGAISGPVFAALSVRGRRFLFEFVQLSKNIEASEVWRAGNLAKPLTTAAEIRDTHSWRWAGSYYVLSIGSLAFTVLYGVLLVAAVGWRVAGMLALVVVALAIIGPKVYVLLKKLTRRKESPDAAQRAA